jgi:hypothetical protein
MYRWTKNVHQLALDWTPYVNGTNLSGVSVFRLLMFILVLALAGFWKPLFYLVVLVILVGAIFRVFR